MKLTIVNSSSAGNAYILETATEALLIECGVRMERIKKAIGFNVSKIKGCLLSHEHKDHAVAAHEVAAAGINLFASKGTFEAIGKHFRFRHIQAHQSFQVGSFRVYAFDIEHDAAEPLCFLIHHPECGNVLFLTDSFYVKYTFPGMNNIIVEANYCERILDEKLAAGASPLVVRNRVIGSHMSLRTCKEFLQANDLSAVNNIVLIHLSSGHSDAVRFQKEIQQVTGKVVHVAEAGMVIDPFNVTPF